MDVGHFLIAVALEACYQDWLHGEGLVAYDKLRAKIPSIPFVDRDRESWFRNTAAPIMAHEQERRTRG